VLLVKGLRTQLQLTRLQQFPAWYSSNYWDMSSRQKLSATKIFVTLYLWINPQIFQQKPCSFCRFGVFFKKILKKHCTVLLLMCHSENEVSSRIWSKTSSLESWLLQPYAFRFRVRHKIGVWGISDLMRIATPPPFFGFDYLVLMYAEYSGKLMHRLASFLLSLFSILLTEYYLK